MLGEGNVLMKYLKEKRYSIIDFAIMCSVGGLLVATLSAIGEMSK